MRLPLHHHHKLGNGSFALVGTWPGVPESRCGESSGEEIELSEVMRAADFGGTNGVRQLLPAGLLVDLDSDGRLDVLGRRVTFHAAQP